MEIVLLRAALAPTLVLLASVVARRMGPRAGGQLLGAPLTTGPFLALTWLESGSGKAAAAAHGTVAGTLVVACFCLAYARTAQAGRPARALLFALVTAAGAAVLGLVLANVWLSAALTLTVIGAGLLTLSSGPGTARPPRPAPRWETAARMALTALIVTAALAASTALGPLVGGVLSSLPVLLSVMGLSVHRVAGAQAAVDMMRGALRSAVGTLGFLLVLCFAPVPLGPTASFALAATALVGADRLVGFCGQRAAVALPV